MAKNNKGNFLVGVIVGGLIGAALALIFVSREEEEASASLREKGIELKGKLEEWEKKGKELLDEQVTRVEEAISEGKEAAKKTREEMMEQFEEEKARPPEEVPSEA